MLREVFFFYAPAPVPDNSNPNPPDVTPDLLSTDATPLVTNTNTEVEPARNNGVNGVGA
jgi:hypothetical protein